MTFGPMGESYNVHRQKRTRKKTKPCLLFLHRFILLYTYLMYFQQSYFILSCLLWELLGEEKLFDEDDMRSQLAKIIAFLKKDETDPVISSEMLADARKTYVYILCS